jgi:hypothetical protein
LDAKQAVKDVIEVVNTWQEHFAKLRVCQEDIESLALRIYGAVLIEQRQFGKTNAQYRPINTRE